jgi:predicted Rdx family selenoprotein
VVKIYHQDPVTNGVATTTLWDRKTEGGFPETKVWILSMTYHFQRSLTYAQVLKQRVRNVIDPGRNLGHVDGKKAIKANSEASATEDTPENGASACAPKNSAAGEVCEDCQ